MRYVKVGALLTLTPKGPSPDFMLELIKTRPGLRSQSLDLHEVASKASLSHLHFEIALLA
jgi:hypothetical protein